VVSHQDKLKVMRKSDKLKNIEELNKRLLGESFHMPDGTPIPVDNNHMPIKETHVDTDEGKMEYIKGALKNLNSNNLDKVYRMVEKYDPNYKPNVAKGNYRQSSAPGEIMSDDDWYKLELSPR
jgi:hypothetical protein